MCSNQTTDVYYEGLELGRDRIAKIVDEYEKIDFPFEEEDDWACSLQGKFEIFLEEVHRNLKEKYKEDVCLYCSDNYPKEDYRSIAWEICFTLQWAQFDGLRPSELHIVKEFLETQPGKELEGWQQWEAFWEAKADAKKHSKYTGPIPYQRPS